MKAGESLTLGVIITQGLTIGAVHWAQPDLGVNSRKGSFMLGAAVIQGTTRVVLRWAQQQPGTGKWGHAIVLCMCQQERRDVKFTMYKKKRALRWARLRFESPDRDST